MHSPRFSLFCTLFLACTLLPQETGKKTIPAKGVIAHRPKPVAIYPVQEGYVDANGVMIYFKTIGHGAPLMIVHGGPGASHDYFLPYLIPLARTNQLIFIDERGSGRSPKLEDATQYTVENMADDVEAVRHALLGERKMALLGHSFGGVVVQAYAFKYQQHLSHLILGSTFNWPDFPAYALGVLLGAFFRYRVFSTRAEFLSAK